MKRLAQYGTNGDQVILYRVESKDDLLPYLDYYMGKIERDYGKMESIDEGVKFAQITESVKNQLGYALYKNGIVKQMIFLRHENEIMLTNAIMTTRGKTFYSFVYMMDRYIDLTKLAFAPNDERVSSMTRGFCTPESVYQHELFSMVPLFFDYKRILNQAAEIITRYEISYYE